MERSPSVASGKGEEELRDQILVQLNGTFRGAATGATFVQNGKTDILIRVDDRHVFVGECKWWRGQKACGQAVDQLLSYLPWRDEKAALILFIDRKDASAVIEKAAEAVRAHLAYKRPGVTSNEPAERQNFVLGHPDDPDREIDWRCYSLCFHAKASADAGSLHDDGRLSDGTPFPGARGRSSLPTSPEPPADQPTNRPVERPRAAGRDG